MFWFPGFTELIDWIYEKGPMFSKSIAKISINIYSTMMVILYQMAGAADQPVHLNVIEQKYRRIDISVWHLVYNRAKAEIDYYMCNAYKTH